MPVTPSTDYCTNGSLREFFAKLTAGTAAFRDREFLLVVDAARQKLRAVARREEITFSEALSYASEAWLESPEAFATAESPWGLTIDRVHRRAADRAFSNRTGISLEELKRAGAAGTPIARTAARNQVPFDAEVQAHIEATPVGGETTTQRGAAARITSQLLEEHAGWNRTDAEHTVDTLLDAVAVYAAAGYQQEDAAVTVEKRFARLLDRLKRDTDLAARLSITQAELTALGMLMLTNRAGAPGVLWLTGIGQDVDPTSKAVRMAVKKLAR